MEGSISSKTKILTKEESLERRRLPSISPERSSERKRQPKRNSSDETSSSCEKSRSQKNRRSPSTISRRRSSPIRTRDPRSPSPRSTQDREALGQLRRKHKNKYWDVPPPGFEHITPMQYKAMQTSGQLSNNVLGREFSSNTAAATPVLGSHIVHQSRRLYVGNIPFGVSETEMQEFFNQQMHSTGLAQSPGNPIIAAQINLDKNFAFLEFRSIEETTSATAFDGIVYQGQSLKIRRPRDYQPVPGINDSMVSLMSTSYSDSAYKLFIGCLPVYITEDQIRELLLSFGSLRAFNLVMDSATGMSKGYAFCEYMDPAVSDLAISGLHGMNLGEKRLVVQYANQNAHNASVAASQQQLNNSGNVPIQIPGITSVTNFNAQEMPATEVLCLLNMVSEQDLIDDDEYEDIMEDIKNECCKFGSIKSLEIPRPLVNVDVPGVGKIFIEFHSVDDCVRANHALTGRKFSNRVVVTSYYDKEKYHRREF